MCSISLTTLITSHLISSLAQWGESLVGSQWIWYKKGNNVFSIFLGIWLLLFNKCSPILIICFSLFSKLFIYSEKQLPTHKHTIQECHVCMNNELCLTWPFAWLPWQLRRWVTTAAGGEDVAQWYSFQRLLCTFWLTSPPAILHLLFVPLCLSLSGTSPHLGLFPILLLFSPSLCELQIPSSQQSHTDPRETEGELKQTRKPL